MTILQYISLYLLPGVAYTAFLEYYSTKHNLLSPQSPKWKFNERLFHTLLWPVSLVVFIVAFIKNLREMR